MKSTILLITASNTLDTQRCSEYSTAFEDLIRNHPIMREYFKDIPIQFGTELQDIHDSTTPGLWEARLITFAKTWELNIPA